MRTSRVQRPLLPKLRHPAPISAFDKQVLAARAATVAKVRESSASEALAFLTAEPLDPAGPIKAKKQQQ